MKFRFMMAACLVSLLPACGYAQLGALKNKVKAATAAEPAAPKSEPAAAVTKTEPVSEKPAANPANAATVQEGIMIWPESSGKLSPSDAFFIPIHQKYAGKIVFSNQKLVKENTTEAMLKNKFTLADAIYGRVFAQTAVKNYALYRNGDPSRRPEKNEKSEYYIKILIDGTEPKFLLNRDDNGGKYETWNTWNIFVAAKGEDAKENRASVIEAFNKLSPGNHSIILRLYGGDQDIDHTIKPIAEGEFTLEVVAGQAMKIGKNWASFKAEMINAALEKQIVDAINSYAGKQRWNETFIKAKITDKEWYVTKAELTGIPLYRTLNAVVYAKWPDGHCTAQEFSVVQQYNNGTFSKLTEYNSIGNQYRIDCD